MFLLFGLWSCDNACQDLCVEMADYAEECGISVDAEELTACQSAQAEADRAAKRQCRTQGDAETLRTEWSCEDLASYW